MQIIKSVSWVAGLSVVVGGLIASPVRAQSFSDITGTNIWNNTAPIFETDGEFDPALIARISRFNEESERAYRDCNAAIDQAEQNVPTTRRFARQPSAQGAATPVACQQLETLRAEADSLRTAIQQAEQAISRPEFLTW